MAAPSATARADSAGLRHGAFPASASPAKSARLAHARAAARVGRRDVAAAVGNRDLGTDEIAHRGRYLLSSCGAIALASRVTPMAASRARHHERDGARTGRRSVAPLPPSGAAWPQDGLAMAIRHQLAQSDLADQSEQPRAEIAHVMSVISPRCDSPAMWSTSRMASPRQSR